MVYVCENSQDRRRIIAMGAWRGEDTRGEVVNFLDQFRRQLSTVRVDAIGIGHGFAQYLRDCRFPVDPVNVPQPCESRPNWRENDPAARFVNRRAQYYQALADGFERDQIEGLTDETTIGQLAGILYELDSLGRFKLESKADARARGVPSPDRADALMLALGQPYQKLEILLVPNGPIRSSGSGSSSSPMSPFPTGFVEVPDSEDEDRPRSRREQLEAVFGRLGSWRGF